MTIAISAAQSLPPGRIWAQTCEHDPELVRSIDWAYPPSLRQAGVEGKVVFLLVVGTDGRVRSAQLAEGEGETLLLPLALNALKELAFESTFIDGEAVEAITLVRIFFEADASPAPQMTETAVWEAMWSE